MTDAPASLSPRSVVLSTLLGTDPPRMAVRNLLRVTQLFGLPEGTVRTALTRMVQRGDLDTVGDGTYRLAGGLLARQARQRQSQTAERLAWSGRWRVAVVTGDGRSAPERAELRQAMGALRLAEQREGVWLRPDNLPADRSPAARAAADAQCTWFSAHPDGDDAELARRLWDLDGWASVAHGLRRSVAALTARVEAGETAALAEGFVVSAAVLRHFQADPLLPDELVDRRWPGARLRADYDRYDRAYRRLLHDWLVGEDGGTMTAPLDDRFYFHQLLSGRDFGRDDSLAQQMINFSYLIGDRQTRECMVVDPAYDVDSLLAVAERDDMSVTGALVTHYHPDHCGGSMMGHSIEGIATLVERTGVPIHVQAAEAEFVTKVTDVGASQLVSHDAGDVVRVGEVPIELVHTPGHTPGSQCFFVNGCLVAGDTLFLEGCGRTDLPGGDPAELYRSITQTLARVPDDAVLFPGHQYSVASSATMGETRKLNYVFRPKSAEQWMAMFGGA